MNTGTRSKITYDDNLIQLVREKDRERIQFFFQKTKKTKNCWLWKDTLADNGYGIISYRGNHVLAHRFSWALFRGIIPKETPMVLHDCDIRHCVHPDHLYLGTGKDNADDRELWSLDANLRGVLTEKDVLRFLELHDQGMSIKRISDLSGFKYHTVYQAVKGINWGYLQHG